MNPHSKTPARRDRILSLLRARGPADVTNVELNTIAFGYGGCIHELRRMGYRIETRRESENLFCFVLIGEPEKPKPLPTFEQGRRQEEVRGMPLFATVSP